MFCYQCEESAKGQGCTLRGVCGKTDDVAALQDLLIYAIKGVAAYGSRARELGVVVSEADFLLVEGLFTTVTNVNFDRESLADLARRAVAVRDDLAARFQRAYQEARGHAFDERLPEAATWVPASQDTEALIAKGRTVGILANSALDEDSRSLRELLVYGLKGMAAYLYHAYALGYQSDELFAFLHEGLALAADDTATADALVAAALRCGTMGVKTMALLDEANTTSFGNPEPTMVNLGVKPGPAILVSGHDLRDLEELLEQTEGTGINIYTHGEMLPAHGYPAFKKYSHLVGNYGNAWWRQEEEFEKFGGAILMTTNCLVPPRESYKGRLFTTGLVSWPGVSHIVDAPADGSKDFSPVIAMALASQSPEELEQGAIPVGFAHAAVLGVAGKIIAAIQSGAVKRFVVMAGCDGHRKARSYFSDVAKGLPEDTIILTAGCAKYRYNKLGLGDIGGIPRVLDAGQCNDSYSLVVVALKLAEALGIQDINELPIAYDIAWYEQKAVLVLLALLSLGVKKIRLGPVLPAFLSPNVTKVLVDKFDLRPIATVEEDLASIMAVA